MNPRHSSCSRISSSVNSLRFDECFESDKWAILFLFNLILVECNLNDLILNFKTHQLSMRIDELNIFEAKVLLMS